MAKTAVSLRELESRVGQEVGVSPWVDMPQERIDLFAKATEDFQWIHVDPARAKGSPFGGTIAHGFLTLSMLTWLDASIPKDPAGFSGLAMGVNYGFEKVRFVSPVKVGKRISRNDLLANLVALQYRRNEASFVRGAFRVRGDTVEVFPAHYEDSAWRITIARSASMVS